MFQTRAKSIIRVQNLSKEFGLAKLKVLDNISFSINPEERIGLIGLNGSGKSTIIRVLSGTLLPTGGTIEALNNIPSKRDRNFLKNIFVLFGGIFALRQDLTVQENFILEKSMYDLTQNNFQNLLNFFLEKITFLSTITHKYVKTLSLGQKTVCELLLGLLHYPKVLLLDEPILGLDFQAKSIIREIILKYCKKYNATLVITSHDFTDIEQICKRLIILNQGKIILDTSIKDLKSKFSSYKYVEIFLKKNTQNISIPGITILKKEPYKMLLKIAINKINLEQFLTKLIKDPDTVDFNLYNLSLEEIIKNFYHDPEIFHNST